MRKWAWNIDEVVTRLNEQYSQDDLDYLSDDLSDLGDMVAHLPGLDYDSSSYDPQYLQEMLQAVLDRWKKIISEERI